MNKRKILVVDDEPNIRLMVASILNKDYTILEASDGKEAIDIAHTHRPDLILMDILMPKVDGYNACSAIKADRVTKAIPVIMLTGIGYELNKKLAEETGADGYMTKPFNIEELLDMVKRYESTTCAAAS